jgi:transcription initiation factor TFIIIB Brf1 subunit/transcription initiation factor TFIIB
MICPKCGSFMVLDENTNYYFCPKCGTLVENEYYEEKIDLPFFKGDDFHIKNKREKQKLEEVYSLLNELKQKYPYSNYFSDIINRRINYFVKMSVKNQNRKINVLSIFLISCLYIGVEVENFDFVHVVEQTVMNYVNNSDKNDNKFNAKLIKSDKKLIKSDKKLIKSDKKLIKSYKKVLQKVKNHVKKNKNMLKNVKLYEKMKKFY